MKLLSVFGALVALLFSSAAGTIAQPTANDADRLASAQKLYSEKRWEETAQLANGQTAQSPELDYLRGMALVHLERWQEARDAFSAGHQKAPKDSRFLAERAGTEYRLKDFAAAKKDLRNVLRLNPKDEYAQEFLGTIYLLEGNLDAALKYWNPMEKPRLANVALDPEPRLKQRLISQAVSFSAPQVLTQDSLLTTEARLENLGIFLKPRLELTPVGETDYSATLHLSERNSWGDSKWSDLISLLSGVPYQTVYPEWYNIAGRAINFSSMIRWDAQKRRVFASLSSPVEGRADRMASVFVDARDENWNLSQTFSGSSSPLTDLNLRRFEAGVELRFAANGNWSWTAGAGVVGRKFLNAGTSLSPGVAPFFANSTSMEAWLGAKRTLWRVPERRFTVDGEAKSRFGRGFKDELGPFGSLGGTLRAKWLPHARGDDDAIQFRVRGSNTFGTVPLDQLFELGLDRDTTLWLRGHGATTDGKKGGAPLGRRYVLLNSEYDKTLYDGGFFRFQAGPFLDMGKITDPSGVFGDRRWLVDTGVQVKLRVLGSVSVVLSYGRDLRNGRGAFFGTTEH
ncbi:MAG TPA: tetratricopeptide repeat protein [Candidatus Dormibacteraeota bacterium]|nr:tetratricopeptide repeat protein [Candidatus Dormibacteraeota bacterium]